MDFLFYIFVPPETSVSPPVRGGIVCFYFSFDFLSFLTFIFISSISTLIKLDEQSLNTLAAPKMDFTAFVRKDGSSSEEDKNQTPTLTAQLLQHAALNKVLRSNEDTPSDVSTAVSATAMVNTSLRAALREWWKIIKESMASFCRSVKSKTKKFALYIKKALVTMLEWMKDRKNDFLAWIKTLSRVDPNLTVDDNEATANDLDESYFIQSVVDYADRDIADAERTQDRNDAYLIIMAHFMKKYHYWRHDSRSAAIQVKRTYRTEIEDVLRAREVHFDTVPLSMTSFSPDVVNSHAFNFKPQDGRSWLDALSPSSLIATLTSLASSVLIAIKSVTSFFDGLDVMAFSRALGDLVGSYNNVVRSGLGEWVSWFFDKVVFVITGYHWDTRIELEEKWNNYVQSVTETLALVTTTRNPTPVQLYAITSGMQELNMIFPLLAKCDSKLSSSRKGVLDHLRNLSAQYDVGAIPVERVKPVTILMAGKAGCGKTFTQNVLVQEVISRACDLIADFDPKSPDLANLKALGKTPTKFSYNCINGKAEYDDGYRNQPFVCYEELGTVTNQEQQRQWLGKFFAASDSEPYLLNMAFADKGKRYFNSPFVIATTNAIDDIAAIKCLSEPDAIRRRIEFHLIVEYKGSPDLFEPEKVKFSFHDKALEVVANPQITPSKLLRGLLPKLTREFGINELCNAVAMVYVERLHKKSTLRTMRCSPVKELNEVFAQYMGGSGDRNSFLMPYAKDTGSKSVFTTGQLKNEFPPIDCMARTPEVASHFVNLMKSRDTRGNAEIFFELAYQSHCILNHKVQKPSTLKEFIMLSPFKYLVWDFELDDLRQQVVKRLSKFSYSIEGHVLYAISPHLHYSVRINECDWKDMCEMIKLTYSIEDEFSLADFFDEGKGEAPPSDGFWCKLEDSWKKFIYEFKPQMDLTIEKEDDWYALDNVEFPKAPLKVDSLAERFGCAVVLLREQLPRIALFPATVHEAFHQLRRTASYGKAISEFFDSIGPHNEELNFSALYTLATRNWAQLRSRFSDPKGNVRRADMRMVVKAVAYTIGKLRAAKALTEERKNYYHGIEDDEMIKMSALASYKYCTPYQLSAFRVELKKIGFAFTKDGTRLTVLDPEVTRKYKARVAKNKIRNGTVPPKPKRVLTADEKQSRFNAKRSVAAEKRSVLKREKAVRTQRAHKYNDQIGETDVNSPIDYLVRTLDKARVLIPRARGRSFPSQVASWFTKTFAQNVIESAGGDSTVAESAFYHLGDYVLAQHDIPNRDILLIVYAMWCSRVLDIVSTTHYFTIDRLVLSNLHVSIKKPYEILRELMYHVLILNGLSKSVASEVSKHTFYGDKVTDSKVLEFYNDEFIEAACAGLHDLIVEGRCNQIIYSVDHIRVDFSGANLPNPGRIAPVEGLGIAATVGGVIGGIINIAIIAGIIYGIVKLVQFLSRDTTPPPVSFQEMKAYAETQGYTVTLDPQSGDSDPNRRPAKPIKATSISGDKIVEQSGGYNGITQSTVTNLYGIFICQNPSNLDEGTHIASLLFVAGRIAVVPKHVYKAMVSNKLGIWLCPVCPGRPSFFLARPMEQLKSVSDIGSHHENVLIDVDLVRMQYHKKIVNYFATEAESSSYAKGVMNGWAVRSVKQQGYYEQAPVTRMFRMEEDQVKQITTSGGILARSYDHYRSAVVGPAACGAPIFVEMGTSKSVIRGIHVAGTDKGNNGIGVPVTKEWLESCIERYTSNFNPQSASATYAHIAFEEECPIGSWEHNAHGEYLCKIITSATGGSTAFAPTEFTKEGFKGGSPVKPCHQGQANYELAEAKMHKRDGCAFPSPQAIAAVNDISELIADKFISCPLAVYSDCRTLTGEEALDAHPELTPCDPTTSRGVRLRHMKIDKKEILTYNNVPPVAEKRQKVVDLSDSMLSQASEGVFHRIVSIAKLKDELLENAFVEAGKCRLFHVVDFVDNLNIKRCIGDFVAKTGTTYLTGTQACGVNMRGSDARLIYNKFVGRRIEESDVSGFDFGVCTLVMPIVSVFAHRAYPRARDRVLFMWAILAILNTVMFNMGRGEWRGLGNTSGNWATTWLNTLMNTLYFCVATYLLAIENDEDPYECVRELLLKIYSDDNITALDRPWYTATNLSRVFMTHFKVELTATDKGELRDRFLTIDDAEFLSRSFRYERGAVFCPLNPSSLYAQLYYVRVPHIYRNDEDFLHHQLRINLANVALELYEYDKTRRDDMAREIFEFLERINLPRIWFPYRFDDDLITARIAA